ncbi:hypothetical protein FA95DRAFT_121184 [Auriscalpium vulgare]|uniref:Uncharacterized protein n=1 Tax=Auriscalpium vulgare TaxID=40419 RepID=A0ACB8RNB7_9AGAM|nr:hypothetical protein FA95DRAFT_121184 [Auriscalpium vulgare]
MFALPTYLVLLLAATLSTCQSSQTPSSTSARLSSSAPRSSTVSSSSTQFANITTTNANGSTFVSSIPITVAPSSGSASATTTSSAAFPSLAGYPTCVTDCLATSISDVNCTSITDVNCYCVNGSNFPVDLFACVSDVNCVGNLQSAESLAQKFCLIASSSVSLSFPATSSLASSTAPPSSIAAPTSSSPPPSTSAAPNSAVGRSWTGADSASLTVSLLGVMLGAMLL